MRTARRFLGLFAGERDDAAAAADDSVALFAVAVRVVLLAPAGIDALPADAAAADQATVAAHAQAAADAVEAGFAARKELISRPPQPRQHHPRSSRSV